MAGFSPSKIALTPEILALVGAISHKQGLLTAQQRHIQNESRIESEASIDAVHFSTKIEGNTLSRDQVTEALGSRKSKAPTRDLREVLNYAHARRSVREWAQRGKPLNDEWVLSHHALILRGIVKGKLLGHFREAQCVIKDSKSRATVYMAPEWREVAPLMKGLLAWVRTQRTEGSHALLIAAQFHFEFVTIHPFMDGNGRLARLLGNGLLMLAQYDVERYAALEKQHERDRTAYYRALRSLQADTYYEIPPGQNIQSWVTYWLRCLDRTYDEALERLLDLPLASISDQPLEIDDRLKKAEAIFRRHKKLRAGEYADLAGLGRTQAVADLNALVEAKVIVRVGGGRSTIYRLKGGE